MANKVQIQEQVIEDLVTGLTFTFNVAPESEVATYRMRITGDIPFGNRDIYFDKNGVLAGMGTSVVGVRRKQSPERKRPPLDMAAEAAMAERDDWI